MCNVGTRKYSKIRFRNTGFRVITVLKTGFQGCINEGAFLRETVAPL